MLWGERDREPIIARARNGAAHRTTMSTAATAGIDLAQSALISAVGRAAGTARRFALGHDHDRRFVIDASEQFGERRLDGHPLDAALDPVPSAQSLENPHLVLRR